MASASFAPPAQTPRHALVTGGGTGIGAAVARRLVWNGFKVTVLGRRIDKVAAVASSAPDRLMAVAADVVDAGRIASALVLATERFRPVQVLVNNAGRAESAAFAKMDDALWQRMLDVNLTGTMRCIQAVLPGMVEAGWGRIVNVPSTAGQVGYAYVSAYCAAKHGVIGLTRSLALELATKGVAVNAVCPGYTETEIARESIARIVAKTGRREEAGRGEFVKANPQGRLITPDDVAEAVTWLAWNAAESITGQSMSVSGGEVTS